MVAKLILQESTAYHLHERTEVLAPSADELKVGRIWRVCIIREGWSKNKRYYGREALKRAAPLWEGAPIALYAVDAQGRRDHLVRHARAAGEAPGGNVAGFTARVQFEENGPSGPGIYGDFHCSSEQLRETALAALTAGVPCPLGLSIDANGLGEMGLAEGRSGLIVSEITEVLETTVVSNPAAGGAFVALIASENEEESKMKGLRRFLERRLRRQNGNADAVPGMSPQALAEACATQLKEMGGDSAILGLALEFLKAGKTDEAIMALEKMVDAQPEAPESPEMPEGEDKKKKLAPAMEAVASVSNVNFAPLERVAALEAQMAADRCAFTLRESLAASGLPDTVQGFIRKRFAGRVFESTELAEAIDDGRNMLASALPQTGIQATESRASVGVEKYDRLRAAVDLLWTGSVPEGLQESEAHRQARRGGAPRIREIAQEWYDDPRCIGRPGPNAIVLGEATTADLPNILGTSIHRRVAQIFMARQREYERWVRLEQASNFKLQEILVEGAIGQLAAVSQGDGYGTATYSYGVLGGDDKQTASIGKWGRVFGITREVLKNDDMRYLQRLPQMIADAGLLTEKVQVYKALAGMLGGTINGDTCYTGEAVYSLAHGNYGSSAFNHAALVAAILRKLNTRQRGAKTTITSGINDSTTTIPVTRTRGFNAGQQFVIGAETMTIQSVDSTTQFTVATRTGATSHSSGAALRQLLDQVVLSKHTLVVPTDLVGTAAEVLETPLKPDTANNNGNSLRRLAPDIELQHVHNSFLGNDSNNWFMPIAADEGHFIELAHLDGERTPFVGVAEGQEHFNMLMADQTDFKARFEFYVTVVNPFGSDGNIVSGS